MNQTNTLDYFTQTTTEENTDEGEPSKQFGFTDGICSSCLDTGFKHIIKDGVLGVAYLDFQQDENGTPIRKLMVCNHQTQANC